MCVQIGCFNCRYKNNAQAQMEPCKSICVQCSCWRSMHENKKAYQSR